MRLLCFVIIVTFFSFNAAATAFNIDGELNEAQWQEALNIEKFYVVEPFDLSEPQWPTQVKVFVDNTGIYVAFTCYQPLATQHRTRSQRDQDIQGDKAQVIIDFDANAVAAYAFELGNGDSILDAILSDETNLSRDWDGQWLGRSKSYEDRWVAEFHIPWEVAPMSQAKGDTRPIAIYLRRRISYSGIEVASAPESNNRVRFLSAFPTVHIANQSRSSLKVFGSATGGANFMNSEQRFDPSVDIFWQPDSSQQISLAVKPDFAQVEADSLVVNFSPEEVFFEEKRPFFTENQSLFDVQGNRDLRLVHTRRIGGLNDLGIQITDINAALKYSKTGKQLNYGVFMVNEAEQAGAAGRDYLVGRGRVRHNNFLFGGLSTFVDRPDLDRQAFSHTIDMEYRNKAGIELSSLLSTSQVEIQGEAPSLRRGLAYSGAAAKQMSDTLIASMDTLFRVVCLRWSL